MISLEKLTPKQKEKLRKEEEKLILFPGTT